LLPFVPSRGDEDRTRAERGQHGVLEQAAVRNAEAHVDDARARLDRRLEPGDDLGHEQLPDVDRAQCGLWVDADEEEAVLRRGDDR
jgi:hypothetical protein